MTKWVISIVASMFILGCQAHTYADTKSGSVQPITAAKFAKNPEQYDSKQVVVRGFLAPAGRDLVLYPNKKEADESNYFENSVLVYDTSPDRILGFEGTEEDVNCTQHYVELTGVAGLLKARGFHGIVEILEIRRFESAQFSGKGEVCFLA
jgi:stage V sporulation protein SpoVS